MVCEKCGGIECGKDDGKLNSLDSNGDSIIEFYDKPLYPAILYCVKCKKYTYAIFFDEVKKSERIKIFKMTPKQRKEWKRNFLLFKELER